VEYATNQKITGSAARSAFGIPPGAGEGLAGIDLVMMGTNYEVISFGLPAFFY
jgi:hypothetical protein